MMIAMKTSVATYKVECHMPGIVFTQPTETAERAFTSFHRLCTSRHSDEIASARKIPKSIASTFAAAMFTESMDGPAIVSTEGPWVVYDT